MEPVPNSYLPVLEGYLLIPDNHLYIGCPLELEGQAKTSSVLVMEETARLENVGVVWKTGNLRTKK